MKTVTNQIQTMAKNYCEGVVSATAYLSSFEQFEDYLLTVVERPSSFTQEQGILAAVLLRRMCGQGAATLKETAENFDVSVREVFTVARSTDDLIYWIDSANHKIWLSGK